MTDDTHERGREVRRAVLGGDYVDRTERDRSPLTADFQDFVTRYAWGEVWSRPGLDRRTRSLITVAILTALGRHEELELHLGGAVRNGVTVEELAEALLHCGLYAGLPAARTAFGIAQRVLPDGGAATP